MFAGDDKTIPVRVTLKSTGENTSVSGMPVRSSFETTNKNRNTIEIVKRNSAAGEGGGDDEIKIVEPSLIQVYLIPSDTENFETQVLLFDVEVDHSTYGRKTVLKEKLKVIKDVTRH